jgi:hypothetical protein
LFEPLAGVIFDPDLLCFGGDFTVKI